MILKVLFVSWKAKEHLYEDSAQKLTYDRHIIMMLDFWEIRHVLGGKNYVFLCLPLLLVSLMSSSSVEIDGFNCNNIVSTDLNFSN